MGRPDCRIQIPGIAVSATAGASPVLSQRLIEGTLDLAIMYRPSRGPHDRAPLRRGVRAGFLGNGCPAWRQRLSAHRLGTDFTPGSRGCISGNTRTLRCTLTSARWGSTISWPTNAPDISALAWPVRADLSEGGCGSRSGCKVRLSGLHGLSGDAQRWVRMSQFFGV